MIRGCVLPFASVPGINLATLAAVNTLACEAHIFGQKGPAPGGLARYEKFESETGGRVFAASETGQSAGLTGGACLGGL
jgi:hypothetical protein